MGSCRTFEELTLALGLDDRRPASPDLVLLTIFIVVNIITSMSTQQQLYSHLSR